MATTDRKRLTIEEAYELVKLYVHKNWYSFKSQLGRYMDEEDIVQDIMLKLYKENDNPDYDPNWKPGEPAYFYATRSRAEDARKKEVATDYMLKDGYNPDDPYDSVYHLMTEPTFNYLSKYNGRTTSKNYYIATIVLNNLRDKVDKRDRMRYAASFDDKIGGADSDDKEMTLGDKIADPDSEEEIYREVDRATLKKVLTDIMNALDVTPLSDRIVGYSPITGQKDSDGNEIETPLTARDIGFFIMYGYNPEDLVPIYKDVKTGNSVSLSTIRKRWNEALLVIREAMLDSAEAWDLGLFDDYDIKS